MDQAGESKARRGRGRVYDTVVLSDPMGIVLLACAYGTCHATDKASKITNIARSKCILRYCGNNIAAPANLKINKAVLRAGRCPVWSRGVSRTNCPKR